MCTVNDIYNEVMMHHDMNKIPVGYKSFCMSAIKETLFKNGISMEREVHVELSESLLSESEYDESISESELYSTNEYDFYG